MAQTGRPRCNGRVSSTATAVAVAAVTGAQIAAIHTHASVLVDSTQARKQAMSVENEPSGSLAKKRKNGHTLCQNGHLVPLGPDGQRHYNDGSTGGPTSICESFSIPAS